jgi:hypothetical protein
MLEQISKLIGTLSLLIRVALRDGSVSDWSKWITFPSSGYGEIMRLGPFRIDDVGYLEIDPVEVKNIGKRVSEKRIDHSDELKEALRVLNIEYEQVNNLIRIFLV